MAGRVGDVRPPRKRLWEEVIWGTGLTSEAQVWARLGAEAGDQVRQTPDPRPGMGSTPGVRRAPGGAGAEAGHPAAGVGEMRAPGWGVRCGRRSLTLSPAAGGKDDFA